MYVEVVFDQKRRPHRAIELIALIERNVLEENVASGQELELDPVALVGREPHVGSVLADSPHPPVGDSPAVDRLVDLVLPRRHLDEDVPVEALGERFVDGKQSVRVPAEVVDRVHPLLESEPAPQRLPLRSLLVRPRVRPFFRRIIRRIVRIVPSTTAGERAATDREGSEEGPSLHYRYLRGGGLCYTAHTAERTGLQNRGPGAALSGPSAGLTDRRASARHSANADPTVGPRALR